ncbi:heavy metal sensor histidine kinase [Hydrogenophaga aquatica]
MKPVRLTLTARLTVLFTLVAATVLLGLGFLVAWSTARHFVELDRTYLGDKAHLVQKLVSDAASPAALAAALDDMLDSHNGLFIQVWLDSSLIYGPNDLIENAPATALVSGGIAEWPHAGQALRGIVENLRLPPSSAMVLPGQQGMGRIVIAADTAHHAHFLASLRKALAIYLLVATVVSGVLGWWAARRGLAPLKAMRDRATAVTAHNLQERMPVAPVPVEFAELAASLNGMFDRLQQDFQRLMDFSSDLAHELRTPLSNLLTQTQVALAQRRNADEYRDILASNAEEFERLARMVSDMLFLAKTENGIDLPHRERIQLHHEVLALFDFYEAVAEERHVRLVLHGQAEMDGDRLMIRRAISNLLSNALRHADAGSVLTVQVSSSGTTTQLQVTNQGKTIAPDDIPRLFDRFYRADRSRAHPASEGAGLGLAITKAIVRSHGGRIRVDSAAGETRFTLEF